MDIPRYRYFPSSSAQYSGEIEICLRECVLNMDETQFADYVDASEKRVIVPATYPHATIPIPVDRNMKQSTTVARVAADGIASKPMIIILRVTIERELLLWGYGSGKVIFKFQENGFITRPLLKGW
jgi:hypothetical protein